jgi:hypothetical protein
MAVAASAGVQVQPLQDDVEGVDVVLRHEGISVDVQLKATSVPKYGQGILKFDLDVKTYDKLRAVPRTAPGYLVVAVLPADRRRWVSHERVHMRMRRLAYWLDMTGMPDVPNSVTVRVEIPLSNRVTEAAVVEIMADARQRLMK